MTRLGMAITETIIHDYDRDKLDGFRRLERFVRAVETRLQPEADFDAVIAHENAISRSLDGRSVYDDRLTTQSVIWPTPL